MNTTQEGPSEKLPITREEKACQERDEYRKALECIVSPLKKIQDDAAEKGQKVNGAFAILLIHDPTFLQNIASESLAKYPQQ